MEGRKQHFGEKYSSLENAYKNLSHKYLLPKKKADSVLKVEKYSLLESTNEKSPTWRFIFQPSVSVCLETRIEWLYTCFT